jgi:hypothetical protein
VFLIPYLAAYLLYYVLRWPVNAAGSERVVKVAGETGNFAPSLLHSLIPPPLLHVYWALHAINVGLAVVALVSWWRGRWQGIACKQAPTAPLSPEKQAAGTSQESTEDGEDGVSAFSFQLSAFLPWLLLALLFYIPGVYLEFPADPWQHYNRINEWAWLHTVGEHGYWAKSSYFLAYSLLGRIAPPTRQLFWLNFYYTGCCLLLCWQYYRLARVVGLGKRASLLFVILQSVLFGNNIFGFYRYYGIGSTMFSQLGAVALIRAAIEVACKKIQVPRPKFQGTEAEISQKETKGMESQVKQESLPSVSSAASVLRSDSIGSRRADTPAAHGSLLLSPFSLLQAGVPAFSFLLSAFASAFALLAFIAFNHPQGLGIAALGLAAVVIWRLIEWNRSMVWWLATAALALSVAAVLWWPRNPALDSAYRPGGWLTAWYGFNVFSFQTDAGDRTRQIIGFFGLINLAAGLVLLRRNHVVAWLTGVPLVALCFPFVAIPLAGFLGKYSDGLGQIILFQRMLLAIPSGLAIVCLAAEIANRKFQVPSFKFQGISEGTSQEDAAQRRANQTAPFSSLPPVESSQEIAEKAEGKARAAEPGHEEAQKDKKTLRHFLVGLRAYLWRKGSTQPADHEGVACKQAPTAFHFPAFRFQLSAFAVLLLTLSALLLVPANRPFYNRFWQALMVPADDLAMRPVIEATDTMAGGGTEGSESGEKALLAIPGIGYVLESAGRACLFDTIRLVQKPPASITDAMVEKLHLADPSVVRNEPFWAVDVLYTPFSQCGSLSGHWLPTDVALELSNQEELFRAPLRPAAERQPPQLWLQWISGPVKTHYYGKGAGVPLQAAVEDRGPINSQKGFATPVAGDQLVLTPMLRTLDCNGWRVCMNLTGPDSFHRHFEVTQRPTHLASEHWIYSSFEVRFPKPGQYTIELVGDVLWPARTYKVRYTLTVASVSSLAGNCVR